MRPLFSSFFALALGSLPATGHAFTADNRLKVAPVSNAVFEVYGRGAQSAREYWCAAGDYAITALGAGATQRIYLVQGRAPSVAEPRRTSVRFSLSPEAAGITPLDPQNSITVTRIGDNIGAAHAQTFCYVGVGRAN
ncbi:hypothetical protein [Thalassococcus sp. S3]|uniref:hypothetical protein n=1 Tax=Thalassococcus sp. S3 TaxID=2017482 RepID=UPI0010245811|nr:hypothetical protein [Thalassococcus sp. S3]QBF31218.1 hypothetical protein CFI11_08305 [Thalassococcus sp. S3]